MPLLLAAGGTALVSGGLWAVSLVERGHLLAVNERIAGGATEDEVGMTAEAWSSYHDRTQVLLYASQATTGLALGLGAVGVVVRW